MSRSVAAGQVLVGGAGRVIDGSLDSRVGAGLGGVGHDLTAGRAGNMPERAADHTLRRTGRGRRGAGGGSAGRGLHGTVRDLTQRDAATLAGDRAGGVLDRALDGRVSSRLSGIGDDLAAGNVARDMLQDPADGAFRRA